MASRRPTSALGERFGLDHSLSKGEILGAIDVGTNAIRLKLARILPDGSFDQVHQERDPIRPGEGVWETGEMPKETAARVVATLARYAAICRRAGAGHVRAVATSALREARNRDEIIERVRAKAKLELEVVSGTEEARLICLGVLRGMPARGKSLLIDIGGGSTEIARAAGEEPVELWSLTLGAVRLTEMFHASADVSREQLTALRRYAQRMVAEELPARIEGGARHALGSSGTIRALQSFVARRGTAHIARDALSLAVEELVLLGAAGRRKRFDAQRADILVAGAVILEAVVHHLRIETVTAVEGGLKEGLLVDLVRRSVQRSSDPLLSEAAILAGRRFSFDEAHAIHTRDVALALFDALERLHQLPTEARMLLEVAAVLHDVGNVVSRSRHHKHSLYLIQNMDLPGLSDHERELAGLIARFHRRSPPARGHASLAPLAPVEFDLVRKLATLLRIADATDRGRGQAVRDVAVQVRGKAVALRFIPRRGRQIAPWDIEADRALFLRVFGKQLVESIEPRRAARD